MCGYWIIGVVYLFHCRYSYSLLVPSTLQKMLEGKSCAETLFFSSLLLKDFVIVFSGENILCLLFFLDIFVNKSCEIVSWWKARLLKCFRASADQLKKLNVSETVTVSVSNCFLQMSTLKVSEYEGWKKLPVLEWAMTWECHALILLFSSGERLLLAVTN